MTTEKLKSMEPVLGGWYIGAKLAEGRHSKVYKAFRVVNSIEQQMCIKTVKFPNDENELSKIIGSDKYKNIDEYLQVLENAIRLNMDKMISLNGNVNVVRYDDYTIVKENSCFYVVMLMELLTPLSSCLKSKQIDSKQVITMGKDICRALDAFRQIGIIHHNIKPENIYVDNSGNYKLGDFGIYEIEQDDAVRINSYTAPEIYRHLDNDTNSDIYSLGILLYKLLNNNRAPFLPDYPAPISLTDRDNAFAKLMRGEMLTSPAKADYELSKIIFKACAYNPAQRYLTPFELEQDFEAYLVNLRDEPIVSAAQQRINAQQSRANHIENDNDYYFPGSSASPSKGNRHQVTDRDKDVYRDVFDDEDEIAEDKGKKKVLYIVLGLVVIAALVVALFLASGKNNEKETTEQTTVISTEKATSVTTTKPTTTKESTTEETTTEETTTEETTTEETTTEETTEETTTEETTTEETTTEETTTEETTTEEATTEETTTEEITTEEKTTKPKQEKPTEPITEPILVFAQNEAGDTNKKGQRYVDIVHYDTKASLKKGSATITIHDDLGEAPVVSGEAYVYIMMGDIAIAPCSASLTCDDNGDGSYTVKVQCLDNEYFYEEGTYQYYVCLEQGALQSDDAISLPLQIRLN